MTESGPDLEALCEGTIGVYDRQAQVWHEQRDQSLYERIWLDPLVQGLEKGARVLDLGCGTGQPISEYLVSLGFAVTGVDASAPMLKLARANVPGADFVECDMRCLTLNQRFDALVSWDAFFHLSPNAQKDLLPKLANLIKPKGRMLMTVGYGEGTALGHVGGETVYHGSLDPEDYKRRLGELGFQHVVYRKNDQRVKNRCILLATEKT